MTFHLFLTYTHIYTHSCTFFKLIESKEHTKQLLSSSTFLYVYTQQLHIITFVEFHLDSSLIRSNLGFVKSIRLRLQYGFH